jgi:predicted DNA-binding protein (UPF0251 family)
MPERVELTTEQIEQVEKLARYLTQEQVADFLGIGRSTFNRIRDRDKRVDQAWQRGRARLINKMAGKLREWAESDNPKAAIPALIFWLKACAGWREKDTPQQTVGNVQVVINAPIPPGLVAANPEAEQPSGRALEIENVAQKTEVIECLPAESGTTEKIGNLPALPARQQWDMADGETEDNDPTSRDTEG